MGACDARSRFAERDLRSRSESRRPGRRSSLLGRLIRCGPVRRGSCPCLTFKRTGACCGGRLESHQRVAGRLGFLAQPPAEQLHGSHAMNATPRALGYRMPAEWEAQEAIWLSWPHNETTWPGVLLPDVERSYSEIIQAL